MFVLVTAGGRGYLPSLVETRDAAAAPAAPRTDPELRMTCPHVSSAQVRKNALDAEVI